MKIIIATGGTGGHIFTGLAIAEELDNLGVKVLIVASKSGMTGAIVKDRYPLKLTWQRALLGKSPKQKLAFPVFLWLSLFQAIYIIMREAPDGVIGTGGFGSFSLVFVAAFLHIPTIITEIDSVPGLTTKILSRFAHEIWLAFPSAKSKLPAKKTMLAGVPVRKKITKPTKTIKDFGLCENKPTIFVFGGSRGARHINEVLEKVLDLKILPDFQFIWQTGDSQLRGEPLATRNSKLPNVYITKFIDDIENAYANADLVVSRAGALTIGEITAIGLPAIFIPYPYATGQHQLLNARALEKTGAAKVILDKDLTSELLAKEIKRIIEDKKLLAKMKTAMKQFSNPATAKLIANRMLELCN